MADFAGKLLDIIGLIPIGKLGKLGKILDKLGDLKAAKKRIEQLRAALERAKAVAKAAQEALEKALKSAADLRAAAENIRKAVAKKRQKIFKEKLEEFKHLPEAEQIRKAREAAEKAVEAEARQAEKAAKSCEESADAAEAAARQEARDAENARRRSQLDLDGASNVVQAILEFLAEIFLPMDLIKCILKLIGVAAAAVIADAGTGGPTTALRGVMTGALRRPVAGEAVLLAHEGTPVAFAITGEAGEFEFDDLPQGEYQLCAATDRLWIKRVLLEAEPSPVIFQVTGGAPVPVQVRDAAGEAVTGASIFLAEIEDDRVVSLTLSETDHTGTAPVSVASLYSSFVILAGVETGSGYTLLPPHYVTGYDPCTCYVYTVPSGGVSGRIVTPDGAALGEAWVNLLALKDGELAATIAQPGGGRAVSGVDGRFSVAIPDGNYVMVAGGAALETVRRRVTIADGALAELGPIALTPAQQTGCLRLSVSDPTGAKTSAYVVLSNEEGEPTGWRGIGGDSGRFDIEQLPVGNYRLNVQGGRPFYLADAKVRVEAECPPVLEIVVTPAASTP
ncbi:MAG: hypothetical protein JNJ53_10075 [Rhizobiales bacterium]|nr:hypothetical protein [Hyphomicrobiales bacterium]